MSLWILTAEISEFCKEGEYFVAAFEDKPTKEELRATLPSASDEKLEHILNGGGRIGYEDEWYILEELNYGENYYDL